MHAIYMEVNLYITYGRELRMRKRERPRERDRDRQTDRQRLPVNSNGEIEVLTPARPAHKSQIVEDGHIVLIAFICRLCI